MLAEYFPAINSMDIARQAIARTAIESEIANEPAGTESYTLLAHHIHENIDVCAAPHLHATRTDEQISLIQFELDELKDTIKDGINDIATIMSIAEGSLSHAGVARNEYPDILRRSGRLVMLASAVDNQELETVFAAVQGEKLYDNQRMIPMTAPLPAMVLTGHAPLQRLRWQQQLTTWMQQTKAVGCPARKVVLDTQNGNRTSLMQVLWGMAVDAKFYSNPSLCVTLE